MIRTGTCSWAEKTLLESGEFYPVGADSAESSLRHYASVFDTVEVDSTYYAVPSQKTVGLWSGGRPGILYSMLRRTPLLPTTLSPRWGLPRSLRRHAAGKEASDGRVYVKDKSAFEDIAESFKNALATPGGKLGIVVLQFPQWLRFGGKSMEDIYFLGRLLGGYAAGVEFRPASWLSEKR